ILDFCLFAFTFPKQCSSFAYFRRVAKVSRRCGGETCPAPAGANLCPVPEGTAIALCAAAEKSRKAAEIRSCFAAEIVLQFHSYSFAWCFSENRRKGMQKC
ncbi:MAG: hypothetical protein LIO60_04595, partial [Oscillospiraceae bacterium]|nr:hypothetical protein [Oscillospiraceae bacterium]